MLIPFQVVQNADVLAPLSIGATLNDIAKTVSSTNLIFECLTAQKEDMSSE